MRLIKVTWLILLLCLGIVIGWVYGGEFAYEQAIMEYGEEW